MLSTIDSSKNVIRASRQLYINLEAPVTALLRVVLHELTANDIKAYVVGLLYSKLKTRYATLDNSFGIDILAHEIRYKAKGVFVWVYYVMHNVLRGLRIGDGIDILRKRIADLPSEVSLYRRM